MIHSLLDFQYLAQSHIINDDQCRKISAALEEFHTYKQHITNAGFRHGAKGNVLEDWQIPKLGLMQNITPSIPLLGPPIHWSADTTERAHIDVVKIPATAMNNIDFEPQISRFLNRYEKCRAFSHALHLRENEMIKPETELMDGSSDTKDNWELDEDGEGVKLSPNGWAPCTALHHITNYFASSAKSFKSQVLPACPFISGQVAFHLRFDLVIGSIKICDVAERYHLLDLHTALVHYIYCNHNDQPLQVGGQRRHHADDPLPFEWLQVWHKI